jgi:hypothetical protein
MRRSPHASVAILAILAAPLQGQETLRWGYRSGDAWEYRMSRERRLSSERVGGGPVGSTSLHSAELQTWTMHASARAVDARGNSTVGWTIARIQLSSDVEGRSFDWDSDRPARGQAGALPMVRILEPLVGRAISVVVTPRGELLELRGLDSLVAAVRETLEPELAAAVDAQVRSMFDGEAARSLFAGSLIPFPVDPVVAGDSWTASSQWPTPLITDSEGTASNTLTRVHTAGGERIAVIEHDESVQGSVEGPTDPLFGPPSAEGSRTGSTEFSLDRGLLVRGRTEMEMVVATNMPPPVFRQRVVISELTHVQLLGPVGGPLRPVRLMGEAPAGSSVVDARTHDGGVTEWTLGNGVRVLLKPETFEAQRIVVLGVSDGGASLATEDELVAARSAISVIGEAGAGDFTPLRLRQALAGRRVSVQPQISEWGEGVRGMAPPDELETLLQLIYLSVTAPRRDEFVYEGWRRARERELSVRPPTTAGAFRDAWIRVTGQDRPWPPPLTEQALGEADLERTFAFYRDRFADAGDFVFNLVGSFEPEQVRPLVERYLGALPTTGRQETWRDDGWRLPAGVVEETALTTVDPASNTTVVFHGPLDYGGPEERFQVRALAAALELRLTRALGSSLGEGRYVAVRPTATRQPYEHYRLEITFSSDPGVADEIVAEIFEQVANLRTLGPSDEEGERVRARLLADHERNARTDTFWSNELWRGALRGEPPAASFLGEPSLIAALDVERFRGAAGALLDEERYVRLTLGPDPSATDAATGGDWLNPAEMQRRFDLETAGGFYPTRIEGRAGDGRLEYRASFAASPRGFQFRSNWGMREAAFEARHAELTAQGFSRIWSQDFLDDAGSRRVQGVWVRLRPYPLPVRR